MTTVVGLAGRKNGGKSTAVNFIIMTQLMRNGVCRQARLNKIGKIEVSDIWGSKLPNHDFFPFHNTQIGNYEIKIDSVLEKIGVKEYSFAEPLKQLCINILGLTYKQCYGSDDDKNSLTKLKWENMPGVSDKSGYMTGREVLQFVGTDIFRRMLSDCWVDATIKQIQKDEVELALISDTRFKNEARALKKEGAFLIKLTRGIADKHKSENDLNDFDGFDCIIDNKNLSIEGQNQALYENIKHLIF